MNIQLKGCDGLADFFANVRYIVWGQWGMLVGGRKRGLIRSCQSITTYYHLYK